MTAGERRDELGRERCPRCRTLVPVELVQTPDELRADCAECGHTFASAIVGSEAVLGPMVDVIARGLEAIRREEEGAP